MAKIKPATRERLNEAFRRGYAAGVAGERKQREDMEKLMSDEQNVLDGLGNDETGADDSEGGE